MNRSNRQPKPSRGRAGTTMVECALTLPLMFFVLFALLDLGIAAVRYNALAEASRRIAREAAIHGSLAPESAGMWGPEEYVGTAADATEFVLPAQNMLPTMQSELVNVRIAWPDGDNSPRDRVQVELTYNHEPIIPGISFWGDLDLRSIATMHVVN